LKYHSGKAFDDYGKLGDQPLDLNEFEIEKDEFDLEWSKSNPKKEHQEILNLISDYLSNNYDQRFGQALFNLRINGFTNKTDPAKEDYKMRDIQASH
jgi:C-terminal processing protease CtpA/Prc